MSGADSSLTSLRSTPIRRSPTKKWVFRLVAAFLGLALGLGLLEGIGAIGLHLVPHPSEFAPRRLQEELLLEGRGVGGEPHPEIEYVNHANLQLPTATTNSFRLRNGPIAKIPDEHTFRILMLGGSVTWGYTARSNDRCISAYLERFLQENSNRSPRLAGKRIEVLNAGVIGYRISHEIRAYELQWRPLKSHVVVAIEGNNEIYAEIRKGESLVDLGSASWLAYRFQRSKFVRFMRTVFPPSIEAIGVKAPEEVAEGYRSSLLTLAGLTAEDDALFVPVLQPNLCVENPKPITEFEARLLELNDRKVEGAAAYYADCYRAFQKVLEKLGVEHPDLLPVDASRIYADEPEIMFVDDCHLTNEARELLARRIGEALLDRFSR